MKYFTLPPCLDQKWLACLLGGLAIVAAIFVASTSNAEGVVQDLALDWKYHLGDAGTEAAKAEHDDSAWESVVLPHTYKLTSINLDDCPDDESQPTFHRDICWYRRQFVAESPQGGRVFLEFEGAHQVTDCWVNGKHVGQHAISAYTPFHFDITDYVRQGESNQVALRLDNRTNENVPPDGQRRDYVLFGGLYRDVRLVVTNPLRITFPWESREAGVRITTPSVTHKDATVSVTTNIENTSSEEAEYVVLTRIADAQGRVVEKLLSDKISIPPGTKHTTIQTGGLDEDVRLWSPDDPYLYRVHTTVLSNGEVMATQTNPLGLRWFGYQKDKGFLINDKPVELIGTNRHQQYPYLGDAVPNNLHRADAIRFKRVGLNVVRLAHYPHDNSFLDACDELGLLVAEEAPTWIEFGPPLWTERLEEAQRRMIRNHFNHPCVWGWGAGINHRGPQKWMHYAAKEEDPYRPTMSNSTVWTGPQHSAITDLYSVMDYRGALLPDDEPLFAMEHYGTFDSVDHQKIVSLYRSEPRRIGLALWSAHFGFSFIKRGERFPNYSEWLASLWDAFRQPLPAYYWYRAELLDEPSVHVPDYRAQTDDKILVYSNCDEVELTVNGESLGKKAADRSGINEHLHAPPFYFSHEWSSGEAVAVGYRDGVVVAEHRTRKPEEADHLRVEIDTDGFDAVADGTSIVLVHVAVCDRYGTTIAGDTPPVSFHADGPGEVIGDASIGANPVVGLSGVATALVRVGREPGVLTVTASVKDLGEATTSIEINDLSSATSPYPAPYEPLLARVDLGGAEQHVEEDWVPWSHEGDGSEFANRFGEEELQFKLDSPSAEALKWTSTWGVPGDLCFLIEDGAESTEPLRLTIIGLQSGTYRFRSWHHRITDESAEAPPLSITVEDADGARVVTDDYAPTFGKKISVTTEGAGDAGDGGSNKAAKGYAEVLIRAIGENPVTLTVTPKVTGGSLTWNGFEISEVVPAKNSNDSP